MLTPFKKISYPSTPTLSFDFFHLIWMESFVTSALLSLPGAVGASLSTSGCSAFPFTVTLQVASNPATLDTLIVAVPSFRAVTTPFSSTVAISSSEELHTRPLSIAPSGVADGVSVTVSPTFNVTFSASRVTASATFCTVNGTTSEIAANPPCPSSTRIWIFLAFFAVVSN